MSFRAYSNLAIAAADKMPFVRWRTEAIQCTLSYKMQDIGPKVVAFACSAGGLGAMRDILAALPSNFPAPIVLAQHRGDSNPELLVQLLAARTALRVKAAASMEWMECGCVYVCPPGMHIEVAGEHLLHTWRGPRLNYVRPSCDLLFQSVAMTFGTRGICVVLTGCGNDGAFATRNVRRAGGFVIAQNERSAAFPDMPIAAAELGSVDLVLPLKDIPFALCRLVEASDKEEVPVAT